MVSRPEHLYEQFVLKWSDDIPKIQKIQMTQYNVVGYLEYENTTSPKTVIGVKIILCRKLDYYIMNIYIPTFCLIIIAGMTLFIDYSHFEVNIMVALTSMLVTYTLYQSISDNLPNTAYMKMIDIWLFGGLTFPFFIVTILVVMDSLIMREKDKVIDMSNEGNRRLKSTIFMNSMQVMVSTLGSTLFVTYWVVGLNHYYTSCPL